MEQTQADAVAATMLQEVHDEISVADAKASMLIAGLGIGISVVLSGLISSNIGRVDVSPAGITLLAGTAMIVAAVVFAALAIWPRHAKGDPSRLIAYWGHIEGFRSGADLAAAIADHGIAEPERTYQQLIVLSSVVQRKYRHIRASLISAGVSGVLVGAAFLIVR